MLRSWPLASGIGVRQRTGRRVPVNLITLRDGHGTGFVTVTGQIQIQLAAHAALRGGIEGNRQGSGAR
jgi:hypothetical protein